MPRHNPVPEVQGPNELFRALRDPGRDLRRRYKGKPLELAKRFNIMLPKKPLVVMQERGLYDPDIHGPITPGLREMVEDVCLGRIEDAAAVGPRGGGKSKGVSFIEFYKTFVESFDALNLGGSELQADQVYQYILQYVESDPYWRELLKGDMLQSKTTLKDGSWIRVLTASSKSVRSPHAGGKKPDGRVAGGILVIDEEAEADADIVSASLFTINTAEPSVNVRCSTFHNLEGSFQELIDNHEEMGYKLYSWDVFDVCKRCKCKDECQSPEPCFREDHIEKYIDPEDGQEKERTLHKAYCGGRARFSSGWIPMSEIEKQWRRIKRNHAVFEVEAMGSRPSTSGHVIKDLKKFSENVVDKSPRELFIPGMPVTICVDWGTVAAGLTVWQEQSPNIVLLEADLITEAGLTEIVGAVLGAETRYRHEFLEVAADIGGGGNYLNPYLDEHHRMDVRDVNFNEEKEAAVAAWNIFNEAGHIIIPAEHEEFIRQIRNWRRSDAGRIQKGDDHLCDSGVCFFAKFIEQLGLSKWRVGPRSVKTSTQAGPPNRVNVQNGQNSMRSGMSRPLVRSLTSRSRRP